MSDDQSPKQLDLQESTDEPVLGANGLTRTHREEVVADLEDENSKFDTPRRIESNVHSDFGTKIVVDDYQGQQHINEGGDSEAVETDIEDVIEDEMNLNLDQEVSDTQRAQVFYAVCDRCVVHMFSIAFHHSGLEILLSAFSCDTWSHRLCNTRQRQLILTQP